MFTRHHSLASLLFGVVACALAVSPVAVGAAKNRDPEFRQVAQVSIDPQPVVEYGGAAYFIGRSVSTGVTLFRVEGAESHATVIASVCSRTVVDCRPGDFVLAKVGDRLLIHTQRGGGKVWSFDGTGAPTRVFERELRRDGVPYAIKAAEGQAVLLLSGERSRLVVADPDGRSWVPITSEPATSVAGTTALGAVFYVVSRPGAWSELYRWRPGGEPVQIARTRSESASTLVESFTVVGEEAYFTGYDDVHGQEPWFASADSGEAQMMGDFTPGYGFTAVNWRSVFEIRRLAGTSAAPLIGSQGVLTHVDLPGRIVGAFGDRAVVVERDRNSGRGDRYAWKLWTAGTPPSDASVVLAGAPDAGGGLPSEDGVFLFAGAADLPSGQPTNGIWKVTAAGTSATPFFSAPSVTPGGKAPWESAFQPLGTSGTRLLLAYQGDVWAGDGTPGSMRRLTQPGEFGRVGPRVAATITVIETRRGARVHAVGDVSLREPSQTLESCRGSVRVAVKRGVRLVASKQARLRRTGSSCTYDLAVDLTKRQTKHHDIRLRATVETTGAGRVAGASSEATKIPEHD